MTAPLFLSLEKMFLSRPFKDRRPTEFDRELGSRLVSRRFEDVWNESKLPLLWEESEEKKGKKEKKSDSATVLPVKAREMEGRGDVNSLG